MSRFSELYKNKIHADLMQKNEYKNPMEVPRLKKIVLNMGVGEGSRDTKKVDAAVRDLTLIAGQKPVATKARNSIAGFKIRDGMLIGTKVTLRNERMYEFLDRLVTMALPRVRDFRGISKKGFDGRGNYNLGLKEQIVFMEVDYDKIDEIRGLDISIVTSAKTDQEAFDLLHAFGMPYTK